MIARRIKRMKKRVKSKRNSRITWTGDDFEQFIAFGAFELGDGELVPKF